MTSDEMLDRADAKAEQVLPIVILACILAAVLHKLRLSVGWLVALPFLALLAKGLWYAWYTRPSGAWAKKRDQEFMQWLAKMPEPAPADEWERSRREQRGERGSQSRFEELG